MTYFRIQPLVVLLTVGLALGLSALLLDTSLAWLFTEELGRRLTEYQIRWWTHDLPLGLGATGVLIATAVPTLRHLRRRSFLDAAGLIAVAILGLATLAGGLHVLRERSWPPPRARALPRPRGARDVFLPEQWWQLSRAPWGTTTTGPLRSGGLGLRDHPGVIPFDPHILRRLTFVGMTPGEVEAVLGPPIPRPSGRPVAFGGFYYRMHPIRGLRRADLTLSFGYTDDGEPVVVNEHVDLERYEY